MFNDICFYVKGNMIKVNGQDFLLGELSASGVWIVLFLGIFTRGHVLLNNFLYFICRF